MAAIFRTRRRTAAVLLVVAFLIAGPSIHLAIAAAVRRARGPLEPGWREVAGERTRGAYFKNDDATAIETMRAYAASHFGSNATFFDFTNRGAQYFLLDRECPIRLLEPAFYEREALQREVIAAIDRNPHVRAALIPPPDPDIWIAVDGVDNAARAPLVWPYLRQHFQPDVSQAEVVIWRRK